jgi:hypothetical protein
MKLTNAGGISTTVFLILLLIAGFSYYYFFVDTLMFSKVIGKNK